MFFKSECEIGNSHYKILNQIVFDLEIYNHDNRKWNKMFTVVAMQTLRWNVVHFRPCNFK